jgi:hypothetical protein
MLLSWCASEEQFAEAIEWAVSEVNADSGLASQSLWTKTASALRAMAAASSRGALQLRARVSGASWSPETVVADLLSVEACSVDNLQLAVRFSEDRTQARRSQWIEANSTALRVLWDKHKGRGRARSFCYDLTTSCIPSFVSKLSFFLLKSFPAVCATGTW